MFKSDQIDLKCAKQSAYVLALIELTDIIKLNGESILDEDIYFIPRVRTNETEALLCIKLNCFLKMLQNAYLEQQEIIEQENNKISDCEYINKISGFEKIQFIQEVKKLCIKYSYIINRIVIHLIDEDWGENYILLNIEPKGNGHLEKIYPRPVITIPGGTMEKQDNNDFEECAFREFYEETCVNIKNTKYVCLAKDKLKCNKHMNHYKHFFKNNKKNKMVYKISWYYSIKILNPEITLKTPNV